MKIISKEYKVYKFDELSDEVKKELIDKEKDNQRELYCDTWLDEDMNYKAKELLNDYFGIDDVDVSPLYSLSYCQGDGAMMVFSINIKDLNNKYKIFSDEEMRFLMNKDIVNDIRIRHNDNYYYHEYTFSIDYDYYNDYEYDDIKDDFDISEKDFNTIDDRFYKLVDTYNKHRSDSEFIRDIVSMNGELANYGYECIEYWWNCSDEEIIGYIHDNDYDYLENGVIFDE